MKRAALFCTVAACVLAADVLSQPGLAEGRWAHPSRASSSAQTTPPAGRSSHTGLTAADSLRHRVAAGEVFITTLPATLDGRPVASYEMLRTPALSSLAGRSFFWRTRSQDAGRQRLLFRARFEASNRNAPGDTLALVVSVE